MQLKNTSILFKLSPTSFNIHWCFLVELITILVAKWWISNFVITSKCICWHSMIRKAFSSLHFFTHVYIYISTDSWVLFYSMECNWLLTSLLFMFKLYQTGSWETLQPGFSVLRRVPIILWAPSLLSSTRTYSRVIKSFSCHIQEISPFSKDSWLLLVEKDI